MYIIKSTDTITNEVYQEEYDTLAGVLGGLFEMRIVNNYIKKL